MREGSAFACSRFAHWLGLGVHGLKQQLWIFNFAPAASATSVFGFQIHGLLDNRRLTALTRNFERTESNAMTSTIDKSFQDALDEAYACHEADELDDCIPLCRNILADPSCPTYVSIQLPAQNWCTWCPADY